jgi:hypothetical protein
MRNTSLLPLVNKSESGTWWDKVVNSRAKGNLNIDRIVNAHRIKKEISKLH